MRRMMLTVTVLCALTVAGVAQQPPPPVRFEVASIKPNKTSAGTVSRISPGGRFSATRVSLQDLILRAYGIERFQLVGGPDWITRERFDVIATANGELTTSGAHPTLPAALRTLLEDRFRLVAHVEQRDVQVYALRRISEERLGPNLSPAAVDCLAVPVQERAARGIDCRVSAPGAQGRYFAASSSIRGLAGELRMRVDRPVIDQTGLQGNFKIELNWATIPTQSLAALAAAPASEPLPSREGPSLFFAVQEQLGLKLEPTIASLSVVVIDSVDRPTPN